MTTIYTHALDKAAVKLQDPNTPVHLGIPPLSDYTVLVILDELVQLLVFENAEIDLIIDHVRDRINFLEAHLPPHLSSLVFSQEDSQ